LERVGGNQSHAARLLRITRDALRYKMKKFNLHNESIDHLKGA
jgi:DNA-binding protein Fis